MQQTLASFKQLIEIMAKLRGVNGCPWDKEQTADTIKGHLIEEAYEVVEAINEKNNENLKDELGDLLLQIIFHAQIAVEEKKFNINDVLNGIIEKLIRRHPHIFSGLKVKGVKEILINWEEIKKKERKDKEKTKEPSYLDGVPAGLPALSFSQKLQAKAARVGFDWQEKKDVLEKLDEEIAELKEALNNKDIYAIEEEIGDMFFTLVNIARKTKIDAESSLLRSAVDFEKRFRKMEKLAGAEDKDFVKLSLTEKEALWQKVKATYNL